VVGRFSPLTVTKAFFAVLAVIGGVFLAYLLRKTLLLLLIGLFIATVIDPGVRRLEGWGIPRSIAVLIHYVLFFGLAAFLFLSLVPIIAQQLTDLASLSTAEVNRFLLQPTVDLPFLPGDWNRELSLLLQSTLQHLSVERIPDMLQEFASSLSTVARGSLQFATGLATSVLWFLIDTLVVLLFAFFFEMERDRTTSWLLQFLSPAQQAYAERKLSRIYLKLSQWAKGQIVLCLVIGSLVFIMLTVLRMPYALTLAILAGFTEFIPYVGPFLAAIPGVLIALSQSGVAWALIIALSYYAVQWSENNLIVPLVMRHAVDVSPVAIIFAMLVGVSFPAVIHPILGILLSIPAASIVGIFLDDLRRPAKTAV
ncbi:MAG: AI-2E family transporter, partial [Patescibacteria group bacterium]